MTRPNMFSFTHLCLLMHLFIVKTTHTQKDPTTSVKQPTIALITGHSHSAIGPTTEKQLPSTTNPKFSSLTTRSSNEKNSSKINSITTPVFHFVLFPTRCPPWKIWYPPTLSCLSCAECMQKRLASTFCYNEECNFIYKVQSFDVEIDFKKTSKESISIHKDTHGWKQESITIHKDDTHHWKQLSLALIGVLSSAIFLITAVTVYIVYRYIRKKYKPHTMQVQYMYRDRFPGGETEGSGEYVILHRHLPATQINEVDFFNPQSLSPLPIMPQIDMRANQRARYHRLRRFYSPKRKMMNDYVDDVFESEDSGGSRLSARLPLNTIPEHSESEP